MWHGDRYLLKSVARELSLTFSTSPSTLNPVGHQVILFLPHLPFPLPPHHSCSRSDLIISTRTAEKSFWNGLLIFRFCHRSVHLPTDLTTELPYLMTSGALQLLTEPKPMTLRHVSDHYLALPRCGLQFLTMLGRNHTCAEGPLKQIRKRCTIFSWINFHGCYFFLFFKPSPHACRHWEPKPVLCAFNLVAVLLWKKNGFRF